MVAYVISNVEVFDQDAYGEYQHLALPAIGQYGGKILTRGGAAEVLEGGWAAHRIVVLEELPGGPTTFADPGGERPTHGVPQWCVEIVQRAGGVSGGDGLCDLAPRSSRKGSSGQALQSGIS